MINRKMSSIPLSSPGYLYAITSNALYRDGQGVVKIGATTLSPHERARQLTSATASPEPFYVIYSAATKDVNSAEVQAHELLDEYRVNDKREFFAISARRAIDTIDRVCGVLEEKMPETPWAELFASFPDDGEARELTEAEKWKCAELARNEK